jgi:hypothetical protein
MVGRGLVTVLVLIWVVVVVVIHTVLVGSGVLPESVRLSRLGQSLPCRLMLQVLGDEHCSRHLRGALHRCCRLSAGADALSFDIRLQQQDP